MAYNLPWGSNHPGHLVYLLDLSMSMSSDMMDRLIRVIENVSEKLIAMSEDFGEVKNRFSIRIFGYNKKVKTLFEGSVLELDEKMEATVGKGNPLFDKNAEAKAEELTYTADAFQAALDDVRLWIARQQRAGVPIPAPVVIHVTDGHPIEYEIPNSEAMAKALRVAEQLKAVSVPDGNVLVFNIHIDPNPNSQALRFPVTAPADEARRFLYNASSQMPSVFVERGRQFGAVDGCRFMVANEGDENALARLIAFGSSVPVDML